MATPWHTCSEEVVYRLGPAPSPSLPGIKQVLLSSEDPPNPTHITPCHPHHPPIDVQSILDVIKGAFFWAPDAAGCWLKSAGNDLCKVSAGQKEHQTHIGERMCAM